jgi:RNA polymerase sigma-70 factor (ECF subfamily)
MDARAWMLGRKGRDAVMAGAPVDWEAVYAEQLPHVYNFFRFRTGDTGGAEDLTAQTFEQAWRARASYRPDRGALTTWLFAIARNVAVSHFRRSQKGREVSLDGVEQASHAPAPEELARHHHELLRLRRLIVALPSREQELIALKYGAELTNRAIARLTGVGESHVDTLLHRTVQRLRAAWETPEP